MGYILLLSMDLPKMLRNTNKKFVVVNNYILESLGFHNADDYGYSEVSVLARSRSGCVVIFFDLRSLRATLMTTYTGL